MNRYTIPLAVFIALITILWIGLKFDPRLVPSPLIDKPIPAFTLPRLKNAEVMLSTDELVGQVVLLNVWASWCVACRAEHPLLIQIAENKILPVYGLNYKDTRENALRWLERHGDPYLISAFDEKGRFGIDLGVYGVPETYLLDKNGIIRYKHIGPITREILDSKIMPLVKQLTNPL